MDDEPHGLVEYGGQQELRPQDSSSHAASQIEADLQLAQRLQEEEYELGTAGRGSQDDSEPSADHIDVDESDEYETDEGETEVDFGDDDDPACDGFGGGEETELGTLLQRTASTPAIESEPDVERVGGVRLVGIAAKLKKKKRVGGRQPWTSAQKKAAKRLRSTAPISTTPKPKSKTSKNRKKTILIKTILWKKVKDTTLSDDSTTSTPLQPPSFVNLSNSASVGRPWNKYKTPAVSTAGAALEALDLLASAVLNTDLSNLEQLRNSEQPINFNGLRRLAPDQTDLIYAFTKKCAHPVYRAVRERLFPAFTNTELENLNILQHTTWIELPHTYPSKRSKDLLRAEHIVSALGDQDGKIRPFYVRGYNEKQFWGNHAYTNLGTPIHKLPKHTRDSLIPLKNVEDLGGDIQDDDVGHDAVYTRGFDALKHSKVCTKLIYYDVNIPVQALRGEILPKSKVLLDACMRADFDRHLGVSNQTLTTPATTEEDILADIRRMRSQWDVADALREEADDSADEESPSSSIVQDDTALHSTELHSSTGQDETYSSMDEEGSPTSPPESWSFDFEAEQEDQTHDAKLTGIFQHTAMDSESKTAITSSESQVALNAFPSYVPISAHNRVEYSSIPRSMASVDPSRSGYERHGMSQSNNLSARPTPSFFDIEKLTSEDEARSRGEDQEFIDKAGRPGNSITQSDRQIDQRELSRLDQRTSRYEAAQVESYRPPPWFHHGRRQASQDQNFRFGVQQGSPVPTKSRNMNAVDGYGGLANARSNPRNNHVFTHSSRTKYQPRNRMPMNAAPTTLTGPMRNMVMSRSVNLPAGLANAVVGQKRVRDEMSGTAPGAHIAKKTRIDEGQSQ